jgi:dTDP-4-amino-4,6-dideoxygalactose transaminase
MFPTKMPVITEKDMSFVNEVLMSGYVNDGDLVRRLEEKVSEIHNCYCVACPNATIGITSCILATKNNSKVAIIPDITMIATAQSAIAAQKHFILTEDVDERFLMNLPSYDWTNDPVIIPVAYNGLKYNCKNIRSKYPASFIVVDAAQSILTKDIVDEHADFFVFSLGAIKNITSGIGGIIATKHNRLYELMRSYRDHGRIDRGTKEKNQHEHVNIGFNLKMSDINAALALSQLNRFEQISKELNNLYNLYKKELPQYNFIYREETEIPWLIECEIKGKNVSSLRKMYGRLSKEKSLKDYVAQPNCSLKEFDNWYYLPSTYTLTNNDVQTIIGEVND